MSIYHDLRPPDSLISHKRLLAQLEDRTMTLYTDWSWGTDILRYTPSHFTIRFSQIFGLSIHHDLRPPGPLISHTRLLAQVEDPTRTLYTKWTSGTDILRYAPSHFIIRFYQSYGMSIHHVLRPPGPLISHTRLLAQVEDPTRTLYTKWSWGTDILRYAESHFIIQFYQSYGMSIHHVLPMPIDPQR